ncbi:hypothetical protein HYPSUDRAFT_37166 [Hypholoma sublateritium FD-334 SS-4]|uniref:RING-type domain-containing protein n=1 Tax=Hypholoma sublateritium (strain FD-334 SS-4) TaxID=945553 RepID=A0A0D2MP96_HYPSF|nr:hypothetical protein HYPSUDRAFT_37166 [Hypholoma sublateritium FD-334 SS-4]
MSDPGRSHRNGSKETSTSGVKRSLGSEITRLRGNPLLQLPPATVRLPVAPGGISTHRPRSSPALPAESLIESLGHTKSGPMDASASSFRDGSLSRGKMTRSSTPRASSGDRKSGPSAVASIPLPPRTMRISVLGSQSQIRPTSTSENAPLCHPPPRTKSRATISKPPHRQLQPNHDSASENLNNKNDTRYSMPPQRVHTGPLAASEFERLKKEVQTLREALHESKKTARRYHKKLEDNETKLNTALTAVIDKDSELSAIKAKQREAQETLSTIEASIQCQICIDMPDKPYALAPCGHVLCLPCLQEWFRQAPSGFDDDDDYEEDPDDILMRPKTCPACRATVRHRPVPVFMVKAVSAALKRANPDPSGSAQADQEDRHVTDPADPWEGIFLSSDEDEDSEGSYATGDEDSDENEDIQGRYTMGHGIVDESDEEPGDDDESADEEEAGGDSSSEEEREWAQPVFAVPSRWAHPSPTHPSYYMP